MIEWDYRVFEEENGDYIIREIFYDEQGQIVSCTRNGVEPVGTSLEELTEQIDAFRQALSQPILTLEDVPQDYEERVYEPNQNNVSHEQIMAELGLLPHVRQDAIVTLPA